VGIAAQEYIQDEEFLRLVYVEGGVNRSAKDPPKIS